jgi:hypothetical protein
MSGFSGAVESFTKPHPYTLTATVPASDTRASLPNSALRKADNLIQDYTTRYEAKVGRTFAAILIRIGLGKIDEVLKLNITGPSTLTDKKIKSISKAESALYCNGLWKHAAPKIKQEMQKELPVHFPSDLPHRDLINMICNDTIRGLHLTFMSQFRANIQKPLRAALTSNLQMKRDALRIMDRPELIHPPK